MTVLEWVVGIAGFSFMCLGVLTFIYLISNLFCGTQNTSNQQTQPEISSCVCGGSGFYDNGYHKLSYCHLCRQGEIERLRAGA